MLQIGPSHFVHLDTAFSPQQQCGAQSTQRVRASAWLAQKARPHLEHRPIASTPQKQSAGTAQTVVEMDDETPMPCAGMPKDRLVRFTLSETSQATTREVPGLLAVNLEGGDPCPRCRARSLVSGMEDNRTSEH